MRSGLYEKLKSGGGRRALKSTLDFVRAAPSMGRQLEEAREGLEQTRQALEQERQRLENQRQRANRARRELNQERRRLDEERQRLKQRALGAKHVIREHLLRRLPQGSVGAEIGVDEGEFSGQILAAVNPRRLHLIDPWKRSREPGPDGQTLVDKRYERVTEKLAAEIQTSQVRVHRDLSSSVSAEFEDSHFDWVYVDGDHRYEAAKEDLDLYYPKVKPGGYLIGDDYGTDVRWNEGVKRAVDEFVSGRPELTPEVIGDQFIIAVPQDKP